MPVETRYARSGEVSLAYQVVGHGAFDLVFVPGYISNLELHWEDPGYSRLLGRLSEFSRLIQFDKRGTGLSDRVANDRLPDLKTRIGDVSAVMAAAGSGRAALLGASEGVPMSLLLAATQPERVRALVLYGGYANFHKWVLSPQALAGFIATVEASWGTGATLPIFAPGRTGDAEFSKWWARFERLSASPSAAVALARMNATIDVSAVLPAISVPTLVIHRRNDRRVDPEASRFLAAQIPGARLEVIPGGDHPIWCGDTDRVADLIEEFLTGARPAPRVDRVLAALLSGRLVAPERIAARLGDAAWRDRLETFHRYVQAICDRFGGRLGAWDGARFAAHFDGPAKAVKAAAALRSSAEALDLPLAQGAHVGEVERSADSIAGLAVHVTDGIADSAGPGDILASSLLAELTTGSGLHFAEHKGVMTNGGQRTLVKVVTEQHLEPAHRHSGEPDLSTLSQREREVAKLVAAGMSNGLIASELRLSEHTVKRHVANILLKLDLPGRAAVAALSARQQSAEGATPGMARPGEAEG